MLTSGCTVVKPALNVRLVEVFVYMQVLVPRPLARYDLKEYILLTTQ